MKKIWQALRLIGRLAHPLPAVHVPLHEAIGRYLLEDVDARVDHPPTDVSAMDGFALAHHVIHQYGTKPIPVVGEISAGMHWRGPAPSGAVRIYTGAALPPGTDTVVEQEKVLFEDHAIRLKTAIQPGRHIRKKGEHFRKGERLLSKGTFVSERVVALCAMAGLAQLKVARRPAVDVFVTGNELLHPGEPHQPGKIYESNGAFLYSALQRYPVNIHHVQHLPDDEITITHALTNSKADVILTTGGVSVGRYDYTQRAAQQAGFRIHVHGVAQKPGKPLLIAQRRSQWLIGLPGNPRAVLAGSYFYVLPLLRRLMGARQWLPRKIRLPLSHDLSASSRTQWLAVRLKGQRVEVLPNQASHMVRSAVEADGWICASGPRAQNSLVPVYLQNHCL